MKPGMHRFEPGRNHMRKQKRAQLISEELLVSITDKVVDQIEIKPDADIRFDISVEVTLGGR